MEEDAFVSNFERGGEKECKRSGSAGVDDRDEYVSGGKGHCSNGRGGAYSAQSGTPVGNGSGTSKKQRTEIESGSNHGSTSSQPQMNMNSVGMMYGEQQHQPQHFFQNQMPMQIPLMSTPQAQPHQGLPMPCMQGQGVPSIPPPHLNLTENQHLMQLQYYEARMREHAAQYAQYASAAADAALAVSHMSMGTNTHTHVGAYYPAQLPTPMSFYPPPPTMPGQLSLQHLNLTQNGGMHNTKNSPFNATGPNQLENTLHARTDRNASSIGQGRKKGGSGRGTGGSGVAKKYKRSISNYSHTSDAEMQMQPSNTSTAPQHHEHRHSVGSSSSAGGNKSGRRTRRRREHSNNSNCPPSNISPRDHDRMGRKTKRTSSGGGGGQGQKYCKLSASSSVTKVETLPDLMGRTGVGAIYDLCNKKHWTAPKFITIESPLMNNNTNTISPKNTNDSSVSTTNTPSSSTTTYVDFIMAVEVNEVELSRGRGGSKKSAQQDAARKALSVLYPGTIFDANGILLDLGRVDKSSIVFGWENANTTNADISTSHNHTHLEGEDEEDCEVCALEELAPSLASRLAIDGNRTSDRVSPVPSEDSSISTTVSMARGCVGNGTSGKRPAPVSVTGGPFIQQKERARNRLAFPSASTTCTSGLSSASEDVDDDEYLKTRGASVCSALLNVMVQIDSRIKDPPVYTFDVCANPATIAAQAKQQQHNDQQTQIQTAGIGTEARKGSSTKRKGVGFSGVGGAIVSKRRSATNAVGRVVTIHRSSFACTASLTLHKTVASNKEGGTPDSNGINIENGEQIKAIEDVNKENSDQTEAKSGNNPAPTTSCSRNVNGVERMEDVILEKIQAVGTGASKREARHVASAQILAMLFPECDGMVEVKAAAEAAREQYAANKALQKRSLNSSDGRRQAKGERRRKTKSGLFVTKDNLRLISPKPNDPPLPESLVNKIMAYSGLRQENDVRNNDPNPPTSDVLAKLSLSESNEEKTPNVKEEESTLAENTVKDASKHQISRQSQLEDIFDHALQSLNDADDERKPLSGYIKEDDLSKTILRRASVDDVSAIERLLSKGRKHNHIRPQTKKGNIMTSIGPLSLIGLSLKTTGDYGNNEHFDISAKASQLWGSQSVLVVLSRAIALPDEPPLGCAVLTLGFSLAKGKTLRIHDIAHEEHFPKERFVECLEALALKMKCSIDSSTISKGTFACKIFFNRDNLLDIVRQYTQPPNEINEVESNDSEGHSMQRRPLQSVKEEDNEDDDSKSNQVHHKRLKVE